MQTIDVRDSLALRFGALGKIHTLLRGKKYFERAHRDALKFVDTINFVGISMLQNRFTEKKEFN